MAKHERDFVNKNKTEFKEKDFRRYPSVGFKSGRTQRTADYRLGIYLFMICIIKRNSCERIVKTVR